jgi:3-deoxy-7-phosphoheptulonate synthase
MSAEYTIGGQLQRDFVRAGYSHLETMVRNTLDISAIPILKRQSHLPVIITEPRRRRHLMVEPLSKPPLPPVPTGS